MRKLPKASKNDSESYMDHAKELEIKVNKESMSIESEDGQLSLNLTQINNKQSSDNVAQIKYQKIKLSENTHEEDTDEEKKSHYSEVIKSTERKSFQFW